MVEPARGLPLAGRAGELMAAWRFARSIAPKSTTKPGALDKLVPVTNPVTYHEPARLNRAVLRAVWASGKRFTATLKATRRLPSGSLVANRQAPRGHPEANLRLPRGYPEATLRLSILLIAKRLGPKAARGAYPRLP